VLAVNTSNNLWVADFVSQFIGYTSGGVTFAITSHEAVLVLVLLEELLCQTLVTNCFGETPITDSCSGTALADCHDQTL
jgi:hypothetical protein